MTKLDLSSTFQFALSSYARSSNFASLFSSLRGQAGLGDAIGSYNVSDLWLVQILITKGYSCPTKGVILVIYKEQLQLLLLVLVYKITIVLQLIIILKVHLYFYNRQLRHLHRAISVHGTTLT
jgi:hypothetical protein